MNVPTMIIELKGFAATAEPLARDLDALGITLERVWGAGIHMITGHKKMYRESFLN